MIWQSFPFPPSSPLLSSSFPFPLLSNFALESDLTYPPVLGRWNSEFGFDCPSAVLEHVLSSAHGERVNFTQVTPLSSLSFAFRFSSWPLDATFRLTGIACVDPSTIAGERACAVVALEDRGAVVRRLEENDERVWAGEKCSAQNLLCKHGRLRQSVRRNVKLKHMTLWERDWGKSLRGIREIRKFRGGTVPAFCFWLLFSFCLWSKSLCGLCSFWPTEWKRVNLNKSIVCRVSVWECYLKAEFDWASRKYLKVTYQPQIKDFFLKLRFTL